MADQPTQPTGTITFLFTDIEGSTRLTQRVGEERYGEIRADHERLLRQAWDDHHGHEVDTQGDAFFVTFARASDALAAAAQAQRATLAHPWPGGAQVRVRMGLHTGAGVVSHDHYVGLDVNRAARICAAGHGGQVLLSQATRDQVAKELAAGEGIRDLGKHRLKDLPNREEIYQLILPGMPRDFPPLKTLDAWPGYRADLVVVLLLSAVLVGAIGLALPYAIPVFPRGIGLGAAGVALAIFLVAQVRPLRRWLVSEWRSARKPAAALTSTLLSLVVIATTLFITKPVIFLPPPPKHLGYDFTYTYHQPTHLGGSVTIAIAAPSLAFAPWNVGTINILQNCIVQLPDTSLGLGGWKPDQCTKVPTVANGDESPDLMTTTLHIDSHAVWSDGVPLTADDFRFEANMWSLETPPPDGKPPILLVPDHDRHTLIIKWPHEHGDYLTDLSTLYPWPLHILATGKFAGVYDPQTGAINAALANQMLVPYCGGAHGCYLGWNSWAPRAFPVVNGPFVVQSIDGDTRVTLTRNPHFFSNFFHQPALDQVTEFAANPDGLLDLALQDNALNADYHRASVNIVEGLTLTDVRQFSGVPAAQVIASPQPVVKLLAFNQRGVAPNAKANGGVSIFTDRTVRQAFVEAFDRCGALRAQFGFNACADPNFITDELATPATADYDPSFKLPAYNPTDAAKLLTEAGYLVVDNIRRAKDGKTPLHIQITTVTVDPATVPLVLARMKQDYERSLNISVDLVSEPLTFDFNLYGQPSYKSGNFDIAVYEDLDLWADPVQVATNSTIIGDPYAQDIPSKTNPDGGNTNGVIDPYVVNQENLGQLSPPGQQSDLLFRDLERYVAGQYYAEPLFIIADVALVKPTICNYKKTPNIFFYNEWNIADWYIAPSCPS